MQAHRAPLLCFLLATRSSSTYPLRRKPTTRRRKKMDVRLAHEAKAISFCASCPSLLRSSFVRTRKKRRSRWSFVRDERNACARNAHQSVGENTVSKSKEERLRARTFRASFLSFVRASNRRERERIRRRRKRGSLFVRRTKKVRADTKLVRVFEMAFLCATVERTSFAAAMDVFVRTFVS